MNPMSEISTELAMSLTAAEARARLDTAAKKLIKHRIILAEIMRQCVEEFKGYERSYIMENCFVGEVRMNEISVDQDVPDADSSIVGSDTAGYQYRNTGRHIPYVFYRNEGNILFGAPDLTTEGHGFQPFGL